MHFFSFKKNVSFLLFFLLFLCLTLSLLSYHAPLTPHKTKPFFSFLCVQNSQAIESQKAPESSKTPTPFLFQTFWNTYKDENKGEIYTILTLELKSQNGYYTYAPNQEGVYPTSIKYVDTLSSGQNSQANPIILYPIGKQKADPFNPDNKIYAYESIQYIFLLFPQNDLANHIHTANNAPQNAELIFSFLACTDAHCLPNEAHIPLYLDQINMANIETIQQEPFYRDFKTLFDSISLQEAQSPSKGISSLKNLAKQENIPRQREESNSSKESPEVNLEQNSDSNYTFTPQPLNTSLEVQSLYKALLFGLLAGFILNFMPCVLPVIGLKIRSFLQSKTDKDTKEETKKLISSFREHNLFFGFGILTWFLILGFLLGVLGFSWGQIFQNPSIVLSLTLFIFAMSLSLFGIYHLPIFGTKMVQIITKNPSASSIINADTENADTEKKRKSPKENSEKFSAFASGLLATLLATPCSGPLLGAVLGYSLTQALPILLTIFLAMGFGMALPYFLFALRPSLVRFMPRAGNWLHNMEQILGFFLIATSIYLFSLLPNDWQMPSLILTFFLAISCTIWGKMGSFHSQGIKKALIGLLCILLVLVPSAFLFQTKETKSWIDFTPQFFAERLGKEVLILKFTADWCPTCKVLEHTVFTAKNMQELSKRTGSESTFLYVDLTEFEESKQNLLKALDSVSIPLLAVFPKGDRAHSPIIIRDMYTLDQVEEAIKLAQ